MASMVGVIMRHGPHHSAQKSTRTGTSEFSTSLSQVASVKVRVFAPAISFKCLLLSDVEAAKRIQPPLSRRYSRIYSTAEAFHEKSFRIPARIRMVHRPGSR